MPDDQKTPGTTSLKTSWKTQTSSLASSPEVRGNNRPVTLLKSAGVEKDSQGNRRTIYSLRHTYATFRLQDGVHQYILAYKLGTSTAMLEKHYGHTSNVVNASEFKKRTSETKRGESGRWIG